MEKQPQQKTPPDTQEPEYHRPPKGWNPKDEQKKFGKKVFGRDPETSPTSNGGSGEKNPKHQKMFEVAESELSRANPES